MTSFGLAGQVVARPALVAMVSTRREAAGARGEEERDGSEDESDEDDEELILGWKREIRQESIRKIRTDLSFF